MGQKVHPFGFRLGVINDWESRWYSKKNYSDILHEDLKIRNYIARNLRQAEVGKVEIVRWPERVTINLHTAKPAFVIGRKGKDVEELKKHLQKMTSKRLHLNIIEVKNPDVTSKLVADRIAYQIKNRVSFKKAMKQAIQNAMKNGAKGVKVMCSGRLGGAEMARIEIYKEGRIPLHTFRSDVDYASSTSFTTFGAIGIKVWIFKGEVLGKHAKANVSDTGAGHTRLIRKKKNNNQ